jgi:hypothetical protein
MQLQYNTKCFNLQRHWTSTIDTRETVPREWNAHVDEGFGARNKLMSAKDKSVQWSSVDKYTLLLGAHEFASASENYARFPALKSYCWATIERERHTHIHQTVSNVATINPPNALHLNHGASIVARQSTFIPPMHHTKLIVRLKFHLL